MDGVDNRSCGRSPQQVVRPSASSVVWSNYFRSRFFVRQSNFFLGVVGSQG